VETKEKEKTGGKNMQLEELEQLAETTPLFNINQAQRATGLGRSYLREKLSRLTKAGKLIRVERGKYTAHNDPLVYATHIETPSYLSFWSGLRFYQLTTQQPTKVQVVTATSRQDLDAIEFIKSDRMFGFRKQQHQGFEITVAEKEKLLLDILNDNKVPLEETEELVRQINLDKLVDYVGRFNSGAVAKRAGYLIDRIRGEKREELKVEDRNYPRLDLTKPPEGDKDCYWRIRVNNHAI